MTANTPDAQTPMPGSELFIHNKDSARAYWWLGTLWIVLADSSDTGDRFSLMEDVAPKGSSPGPHKHTWSDETYYIMDGEITFGSAAKSRPREPAITSWSRGIPHTLFAWRVNSAIPQWLHARQPRSVCRGVGNAGTRTRCSPKGVSPTMEFLATNPELLSRYGIDLLAGPDPLRPAPQHSTQRA